MGAGRVGRPPIGFSVGDAAVFKVDCKIFSHFNEQFRQLDEVSPSEESLPYTTRLTLLQTAFHNIPELRRVATMEEFISLSSSTPGPTMVYDNYVKI